MRDASGALLATMLLVVAPAALCFISWYGCLGGLSQTWQAGSSPDDVVSVCWSSLSVPVPGKIRFDECRRVSPEIQSRVQCPVSRLPCGRRSSLRCAYQESRVVVDTSGLTLRARLPLRANPATTNADRSFPRMALAERNILWHLLAIIVPYTHPPAQSSSSLFFLTAAILLLTSVYITKGGHIRH